MQAQCLIKSVQVPWGSSSVSEVQVQYIIKSIQIQEGSPIILQG